MKKLLLPFIFILFLNNLNAQWITQTAPSANNLFSVFAISPTAVAAAGVTGVIRSINAGTSWSQNVTLGGVNMYELHTATTTKWYSLCQNATWFVKTLNPTGVTLQSGKPDSILSLHFPTQACAIAVGTAGKMVATCDTGATWQTRSSGSVNDLNAIWFANKDTGCAVGVNGTIVRTTDAGSTWTTVPSGTALTFNGIHFPSSTVGYIAGNGGKVLKSMDAGVTWTTVPTGIINTLNGVYFIDADTGYVVGTAGVILKTINGGTSWITMTSGTSNALNSVHFNTPVDGWAVGNAGTILKYGGTVFTGIPSITPDMQVNFYPNPAKNKLTIQTLVNEAQLRISNALGELVYKGEMHGGEMDINISEFKPGVYFVECNGENHYSVKKFIKE